MNEPDWKPGDRVVLPSGEEAYLGHHLGEGWWSATRQTGCVGFITNVHITQCKRPTAAELNRVVILDSPDPPKIVVGKEWEPNPLPAGALDLGPPNITITRGPVVKPAVTVFSTVHGIASWQAANAQDRRVHISLTGRRVEAHATKLSASLATCRIKFDEYLPSEDVPAVMEAAFSAEPPHFAVAATFDDLDPLIAEVG